MACGYWVLTPPTLPGHNCAFRDLQLTATNPIVIYICQQLGTLPKEHAQVGKVSVPLVAIVGHHQLWLTQCEESIGSRLTLDQKKRTIQDWSKLSDCWSPRHGLLSLRALLPPLRLPTTAQAAILVAAR